MWHVGKHRFVLVVGTLVFKFPRIRIIHFLGLLLDDIKHLQFLWTKSPWFWFKEIVLVGILENLREANCYLTTKHKLLTRLFLPLIFVNVYQKEDGVGNFTFDVNELTFKVSEMGDSGYSQALQPCSHTFDYKKNFAYSNGKIKILDYGERGIKKLLTQYGDKIEKLLLSVAKYS